MPMLNAEEILLQAWPDPPRSASCTTSEICTDDTDEDASLTEQVDAPKVKRRKLDYVLAAAPAYPRSSFAGWSPPATVHNERDVIAKLQDEFNSGHSAGLSEFTIFQLHQFSIYRTEQSPRHALELISLDRLQNRTGCNELLFDGVVCLADGTKRYHLQGVPFRTLTIEGYGDLDIDDLAGRICIQSAQAEACQVWYQLGEPSVEYERFHRPFLWLAEFTRHFVNYLLEKNDVTLANFRKDFYQWLHGHYSGIPCFEKWRKYCRNLHDFRSNVSGHIGFLWKECYSIDDPQTGLCKQPLWTEADPERLEVIPEQQNLELKTITTPFAYQCFQQMYFGSMLEKRPVSDQHLLDCIKKRKNKYGLTEFNAIPVKGRSFNAVKLSKPPGSAIKEGDFVGIVPDDDHTWGSSSALWYAYVQNIRRFEDDVVLDVLWLYEPCQTTLQNAYYPFQNELFFSDNCNCGKDAISIDRVTRKVDVTICFHDPAQSSASDATQFTGFFVRRKFGTVHDYDTYDFSSLKYSDLKCSHATAHVPQSVFDHCTSEYAIGDTVLVREWNAELNAERLEPSQVIGFDFKRQRARVRIFERKCIIDSTARSNELRITNNIITKPASKVIRKCQIRIFDREIIAEGLPTPYNFHGAGDFFFIERDLGCVCSSPCNQPGHSPDDPEDIFPSLQHDWDPPGVCESPKLKGLGMFCGGGSFDRGLEDGGAVDFRFAIDWDQAAIHSYRANVDDPGKVQYFQGSVNDALARAIANSPDLVIAKPGDVEFISAGSPCPGFSNMQPDKNSLASLRNASMVASVVSFVDFYSPQYCILENVVTMTSGHGLQRTENVFAQILSSFVAMGYQVQQFNMGSWSYGSPQSRPRVFIIASVPGSELLTPPPYTHDHPQLFRSTRRALGRSSNGLNFGMQRDDYTPFSHLTPAEATRDLPSIGDAQVQVCPAFPDHRTSVEASGWMRSVIASIPVSPGGMSLAQAAHAGRLDGAIREAFDKMHKSKRTINTKSYARVQSDRLFPTVLTALVIACNRTGRVLHWSEPRILTIMELRRAQGFRDHEVILGSAYKQVKIIGNSVDRKVALALGLSLRTSWKRSINAKLTSTREDSANVSPSTAAKIAISSTSDLITIGKKKATRGTTQAVQQFIAVAEQRSAFDALSPVLEASPQMSGRRA